MQRLLRLQVLQELADLPRRTPVGEANARSRLVQLDVAHTIGEESQGEKDACLEVLPAIGLEDALVRPVESRGSLRDGSVGEEECRSRVDVGVLAGGCVFAQPLGD